MNNRFAAIVSVVEYAFSQLEGHMLPLNPTMEPLTLLVHRLVFSCELNVDVERALLQRWCALADMCENAAAKADNDAYSAWITTGADLNDAPDWMEPWRWLESKQVSLLYELARLHGCDAEYIATYHPDDGWT